MRKRPTGGGAFPSTGGPVHSSGMTLRDYYAGIALAVVMVHDEWILDRNPKAKVITDTDMAKAAYQMADAMLKERAK